MDALHAASLEEHVGSLSGHFREKLDNVQNTLRTELSIVPWYIAVAAGIKGDDPAELKNFYAVTWTVYTLGMWILRLTLMLSVLPRKVNWSPWHPWMCCS